MVYLARILLHLRVCAFYEVGAYLLSACVSNFRVIISGIQTSVGPQPICFYGCSQFYCFRYVFQHGFFGPVVYCADLLACATSLILLHQQDVLQARLMSAVPRRYSRLPRNVSSAWSRSAGIFMSYTVCVRVRVSIRVRVRVTILYCDGVRGRYTLPLEAMHVPLGRQTIGTYY